MADSPDPIPADAYDVTYFTHECQGHEEFGRGDDKRLPLRLSKALALAGNLSGKRVLDLGCGRGELVHYGHQHGALMVGADYAPAALQLAQQILPPEGAYLAQADVSALPFANDTFDLVLALDLVEHLYPYQLDAMLSEVFRILAPGGRLIVHTMPNLWYYRYGYPLYRLAQRLRGHRLPKDPRDRSRHVHVNIQSVPMLRAYLSRAGLEANVRLENTQTFAQESSPLAQRVYRFMATTYPLAWVFCNDLFGIAKKVKETP